MAHEKEIEFLNSIKDIFISGHPCCKYLDDYYKENINNIILILKEAKNVNNKAQ